MQPLYRHLYRVEREGISIERGFSTGERGYLYRERVLYRGERVSLPDGERVSL
jgi:hypothetical protein